MAVLVTAEIMGLVQRQRVLDVVTESVNELLVLYWVDENNVAHIPKSEIKELVFTVLWEKGSVIELVELMFEQLVEDFSVFGWDVEDTGDSFVFRPGGSV